MRLRSGPPGRLCYALFDRAFSRQSPVAPPPRKSRDHPPQKVASQDVIPQHVLAPLLARSSSTSGTFCLAANITVSAERGAAEAESSQLKLACSRLPSLAIRYMHLEVR